MNAIQLRCQSNSQSVYYLGDRNCTYNFDAVENINGSCSLMCYVILEEISLAFRHDVSNTHNTKSFAPLASSVGSSCEIVRAIYESPSQEIESYIFTCAPLISSGVQDIYI